MTYREIMAWGKKRHYPQLVLDPLNREVLRHGKEHYQQLRTDRGRRLLATIRINRWNELVARGIREEMKKTA